MSDEKIIRAVSPADPALDEAVLAVLQDAGRPMTTEQVSGAITHTPGGWTAEPVPASVSPYVARPQHPNPARVSLALFRLSVDRRIEPAEEWCGRLWRWVSGWAVRSSRTTPKRGRTLHADSLNPRIIPTVLTLGSPVPPVVVVVSTDDPVPAPEPAPCPLPDDALPTGNPELPPSGPVGPGLLSQEVVS
jgi:hypothetical protein